MRLIIDAQGAQAESRYRGIGRYTGALIDAMVNNSRGHEVILVLNGQFPETIEALRRSLYGQLASENFQVWYAPGPLAQEQDANLPRIQAAARIQEDFITSLKPDVVLVSSLFEGYADNAVTGTAPLSGRYPVAVLLYDLIPLLNPETYLDTNPRYARFYLDKVTALKQATAWLAISHFSAQEGINTLELPEENVINISTACNPMFQCLNLPTLPVPATTGLLAGMGIHKPFVLYSGGADGRKNLPRLIQAYALLDKSIRDQYQLVLAGRIMPDDIYALQQQAHRAGLDENELVLTGYIDDETLVQLYNLCQLFAFPSWHEGFGLPVLEAMSCGAVVIAANASSLPEVIGREDALFDPHDTADMARHLERGLLDATWREAMREHGLARAKTFSWATTADKAWQALEKLQQTWQPATPSASFSESDLYAQLATLHDWSAPAQLALAHCLALNQRQTNRERQLLVDISELVRKDARTGIQRVTRSVLLELLANPPAGYRVWPVYATPLEPGYRYAHRYLAVLNGQQDDPDVALPEDDLIDAFPGDVFLGLDLQHHVVLLQQDYLKFMHRNGVRIHFVVYDLLPILLPHVFAPGAATGHHDWLSVVTAFDGVMCISAAVADELKDWLGAYFPGRKEQLSIDWFHLGADISNSAPSTGLPDTAPATLAALRTRPTFLMVGTIEPRKGQTQTLAAFELLWAAGMAVNLVIVGKAGWMVDDLIKRLRQHPESGQRLFWLEGISDEYLEQVYAASSCLIAASEGEGFGLPLIEAAQQHLPILARDIPVFREVAGEHASYFSAGDGEGLALAVRAWLTDNKSGTAPTSANLPWLTWAESTRMLWQRLLH